MLLRISTSCLLALLTACGSVRSSTATTDEPESVQSEPAPMPPHGRTRNVGVLVFPGVELLDFAGPVEVFTNTERWDVPLRVYTVAADRTPVKTLNGVTVVPDHDVENAPVPDILVIPGGEVRCLSGDTPLARYIRARVPKCEIVFSVCNGIFALTDDGWLDGLSATTHWTAIGFLRAAAPRTTVVENTRFVDNGRIVTAAGISAGIDGALHVVDRLLGARTARETARRMEYEWREAPAQDEADGDPVERARKAWYGGEWAKAVEAYRALAAAQPDDLVVQTRLGTSLLFTGQAEEGLAYLERAARAGSRDVLLYDALGFARSRAGRHQDAIAAYEHGLTLEPGRISLVRGLGTEQATLGLHAQAAANLRRVWDTGQGDDRMLAQIARSLAASGADDDAVEFLTLLAHESREEFAAVLATPELEGLRDDARVVKLRKQTESTRP
jgi:putative intracellular protease/amidase/Tfp pilus assembly protein PilF